MKVIYHDEARREITNAVDYYADRSRATAERLIGDFETAISRIIDNPNAWPPLGRRARRHILAGFPYQIIYRVEAETIHVYAFAHLKRRPMYWRRRLR